MFFELKKKQNKKFEKTKIISTILVFSSQKDEEMEVITKEELKQQISPLFEYAQLKKICILKGS